MRETEILRRLTKAKQNCFQAGMVPSRLDELRARLAAEKDPRRQAGLRQLVRDAEFDEAEATKRAPVAPQPQVLPSQMPGVAPAPAVPVQTLPAPQPTMPVQPVSAPQLTLRGAAEALRGRSAESMGKKYGFERGTPFVEAPRGVSKDGDHVPAMLEHGEAVLPKETVAAVGTKSIRRLIEETTGRSPKQGLRSGLRAQVGAVPSWLEPVERAWNATDMATVSRTAMDDARNSDNFATPAAATPAAATPAAAMPAAATPVATTPEVIGTFQLPNSATPTMRDAIRNGMMPNDLKSGEGLITSSSGRSQFLRTQPSDTPVATTYATRAPAPSAQSAPAQPEVVQRVDTPSPFTEASKAGSWDSLWEAKRQALRSDALNKANAEAFNAGSGRINAEASMLRAQNEPILTREKLGLLREQAQRDSEAAKAKIGLLREQAQRDSEAAKAKMKAEERKDAQKDYEEFFKTTGYNEQDTVGFRDFLNANYSYTGQDGKKKSFADMSWEERRKAMSKMKDEYQLMKQAQARSLGEGTTLGAFEPKETRKMTMKDVSPGEVAGLKMGVKLLNLDNDPKQMSVAEYLGRKYLPDSVAGSDEVVVGKNGEVMRKADYLNAPGPYGSKDRAQTLRDALGK